MKNFLFRAIVIAFLFLFETPMQSIKAQLVNGKSSTTSAVNLVSSTNGTLSDTVLSSGSTKFLIYPVNQYVPSGFFHTNVIQLGVFNLTGTTTLVANIQHSNDGTGWYSLNQDSTYNISSSSTVGWRLQSYVDAYIRIKVTSNAIGTTKITGCSVARKQVLINN